jgi:hypothetical protein
MVRRSTWILVIIFGLLVLTAWLFPRYQANNANKTATATPTTVPTKLYNLTSAEVSSINITDSTGNNIVLYREPGSANWVIKDMPADQADSQQIESLSTQLLSIQVQDTLTQSVSLDSFGLATPAYTITLTTVDNTQYVIYIGTLTPIKNGYYLRIDAGPVVIVNNVTIDDVINLLKKPPLLATAAPNVIATETGTPIAPIAQPTSTP